MTTDGTEYGMRHLENIWRGYELAWCTGFTTSVHGCPTSSEHYKSMMGKTIDSVTYYTDKGIITFDVNDEKVLTKTGVTAKVAGIHTTDTEATVTLDGTLPEGFAAKYAVDGTEVVYADGKITTGTLEAGSHTLVISDTNGEYAPIQATFSVKEAAVPAVYDSENNKLVPVEGATEEQLSAYIKTITAVTVGDKTYQATGRGAKVIVKEDGTLDLTDIEVTNGTKFVVTSSAYDALTFDYVTAEYKYVYAGLTWAQYWAAEGVYAAGDASSSDAKDRRGETDLGAFDAVTRATTNHGLHRGSFQAVAVIEGSKGSYTVSHWEGRNTVVFTDGKKATYNRGSLTFEDGTTDEMTDYKVTGLKYVPVKVKTSDYEAFKNTYAVVENDRTLTGGFGEVNLQSYSLTADVTAKTNGLKTVTKNEDGTFSFSARANGSDSGIKDTALKTAEGVTYTVKPGNGSYGEFLRVDLTGNYGDLGGAMQAVKWTYYGNDSSYANAIQSYGTKFAADNWMHKSNGIQLGLTESQRCQLPEGYDGPGYWTLTVYALGYEDYTYDFQATEENSVLADPVKDRNQLDEAIKKAEELKESDYTADSWKTFSSALKTATGGLYTQKQVNNAVTKLNKAMDELVESATYVLMNIPYDEFYKADVNNDVKVDAFTSATKNKVRTGSLAGGSYHVDASGDEITGVTFPVKVPAGTDLSKYTQITDDSKVSITVTNRGQESTTDYTGKDALFESASYSYYTLSEKPSYYKELTVNEDGTFSFGATQGTATTITEGVTAELMTESKYGDYQLDLDGLTDTIPSGTAIYGVIVSTKEGSDYGMRHLENIWRVSELAWATGFTTAVHNCPTSSEHYKAMMGQHIDKVTYYTANGIYEIPVGGEKGLYVPVKFDTNYYFRSDSSERI